jgi:hypothetical protein
MFLSSASSIVMFIFFFTVGSLPILDDDLLLLGPQIDRDSAGQCLIELLHIVASDIVLALGDELSLHDIREGRDQYLEWLTIIISMSSLLVLGSILEEFDDHIGIGGAREDEGFLSSKLHHDI